MYKNSAHNVHNPDKTANFVLSHVGLFLNGNFPFLSTYKLTRL